jgi:hypothetical protein
LKNGETAMLKQVTELSAKLVEADRLIDEIDELHQGYCQGRFAHGVSLLRINEAIRFYRRKHPSTAPDENWNVLEQEEKETLER